MKPPLLPSERKAALRPSRGLIVLFIVGGLIFLAIGTWFFLTRDIPPIDDSDLAVEDRIVDDEKNPYPKIRELALKSDAEEKIARIREMLLLKSEPVDIQFIESVVSEYSKELADINRFSKIEGWKIDYEINWYETSPEVQVVRSFTRIKRAQIEVLIASEDFSGAVRNSISMIEFGEQFRNSGGNLLHFLVGTFEIKTAQFMIAKIVQMKGLSEVELVELADSLERLRPTNDSFVSSLKVDYQMSSKLFEQISEEWIDLKNLNDGGESSEEANSFMASMYKENRTRLVLAEVCRISVSEVEVPRKEATRNMAEEHVSTSRENMVKLWLSGNVSGNIVLSLLLPLTDGVSDRFAQSKTDHHILMLQVAAERFRLKNGDWPVNLDQLVTEFIVAIPVDDMDGELLRYNSATRRIYSFGRNFVDNKGEVDPKRTGPFRDFEEPMIQLDPNLHSIPK